MILMLNMLLLILVDSGMLKLALVLKLLVRDPGLLLKQSQEFILIKDMFMIVIINGEIHRLP